MIASGDSSFGAPSNRKFVTGKPETFREDSGRPLEKQAPKQRQMQLYLVKETVLHRLGKARTEYRVARSRRHLEKLLDSIVPRTKLLFQDPARYLKKLP